MNSLICFTDGACTNNGYKNARASYAVVWPNNTEMNVGVKLEGQPTNNRAEYSALIHAYKQADEIDPENTKSLVVYTDSMLLINSLTKWLPVWSKNNYKKRDNVQISNLDLVLILEEYYTKRKTIFNHVKAHTNGQSWECIYNNQVDLLAKSMLK